MANNDYCYPAVICPDSGKYSVCFPDLDGCVTYADSLADARAEAMDALALFLCYLEDRGDPIPEPSSYAKIAERTPSPGTVMRVSCNTMVYRRACYHG